MRVTIRPPILVLGLACFYLLLLQWRASPRAGELVALLVAATFGVALTGIYRQRVFTRKNQEGVELYNAGAFQDAAYVFQGNAVRFRYPDLVRGVSIYNLALARLRLGQIENALALFCAVEREPGLRRAPIVHTCCPCWISICHALRGELDAARYWLGMAERSGRTAASLALFAELLVLCRGGCYEQAISLLDGDERWARWRGGSEISVPIALVRSYALEELGRSSDVDATSQLGAYRYLGSSWSSFQTFLNEHGMRDGQT